MPSVEGFLVSAVWELVLAKLGPVDRTLQPNQPKAALATSSGAVEKYTAELDRAIEQTTRIDQLKCYFSGNPLIRVHSWFG